MAKKPAYTYTIKEVVKIVDGDTIDVIVDLGFHISIKKRVRLDGINAPESRTRDLKEKERGLMSKARLKELCETGDVLILECHGLGKYGRVLGEIHNPSINGPLGLSSINRMMVLEGHATEYDGGKR